MEADIDVEATCNQAEETEPTTEAGQKRNPGRESCLLPFVFLHFREWDETVG